ncbi:hypothetical protein [Pseudomonas corrugata]|uniref:hypothetical protein n=1 Tax=Pseudomonas corrugata TaxID=47879 RepID=UPI0028C4FFB5|nr:hypothetical protein [Pseudomonas corrugata]MDU9026003.1 hypothetical protein [Pseudomonas corrugata]
MLGLLCSPAGMNPLATGSSTSLGEQHRATQGRDITIKTVLCPDAYQALMAGDRARHDEILLEAATWVSDEVDVLVLAQASLAHLRDLLAAELKCPVWASPPLLMGEIARRCAECTDKVNTWEAVADCAAHASKTSFSAI